MTGVNHFLRALSFLLASSRWRRRRRGALGRRFGTAGGLFGGVTLGLQGQRLVHSKLCHGKGCLARRCGSDEAGIVAKAGALHATGLL